MHAESMPTRQQMQPSMDSLSSANHTPAGSIGPLIHLLELTMCCIHCRRCSAGPRRPPQAPAGPRRHPVTKAAVTKTVSASFSDDLFHNVSPPGSLFVGRFYYRRRTRWDCMFIGLFSLWFWCVCVCVWGVCVSVCALAPLDDILIFFPTSGWRQLLAIHPWWRAKIKDIHVLVCVWEWTHTLTHTHSSLIRAVEFYKIPGPARIQPRLAAIQSHTDWGTRILVHLVKSGQLIPRMKLIDCWINYKPRTDCPNLMNG